MWYQTVAEGIIICQDEPPSASANRRQTMALERYILHVPRGFSHSGKENLA
jgi:hypothetical protein